MITKFQSDLPAGRARFLARGRHYADAVNQIAERGLEAALEATAILGGVRQPKGLARSLVKAVAKSGPVPAHRISRRARRRYEDGAPVIDIVVETPQLTWKYRGDRQIGMIEWLPAFVVTDHCSAPVLRSPLPG